MGHEFKMLGEGHKFKALGEAHIAEIDVDALMLNSFHERYKSGESIEEGVSGRTGIDTIFEVHVANEEILSLVSSDMTRYEDLPAARDEYANKFPHRRS
jgi:hypothetical protein